MVLADQTALAIENARLIDKVKETAVIQERSRLARELHDAVTQTLFSTSITAEVLPEIWDQDPEEGRRKLEELRDLTRGALAEMRSLLIELRPKAFADGDLHDLMKQLANAFFASVRIPVSVNIKGHCKTSAKITEAFYRIAQEGLANITKHANANQVELALTCQCNRIQLKIQDDGLGFDFEQIHPGRFGLSIMRERAQQIRASFELSSQPGNGTLISVFWSQSN